MRVSVIHLFLNARDCILRRNAEDKIWSFIRSYTQFYMIVRFLNAFSHSSVCSSLSQPVKLQEVDAAAGGGGGASNNVAD